MRIMIQHLSTEFRWLAQPMIPWIMGPRPEEHSEQEWRWGPAGNPLSIAAIIDTATIETDTLGVMWGNCTCGSKSNMNGNTAYQCIQRPCDSTTRSDGFAWNKYNRNLIYWISHSIFLDRWNMICINTFVDRHNTIINPNFIQPQSQSLIQLQLLSGGEGETFLKHRVTMNPDG